MIIGLGNDIISIVRMQKAIERFGTRFEKRVFSHSERELAWKRGSPCYKTYSSRWASKEAFLKALGVGMSKGIAWTDISVENFSSGKPALSIRGGAIKRLNKITPDHFESIMHLTISDDFPWVSAVVIIEAIHPSRSLQKYSKSSREQ